MDQLDHNGDTPIHMAARLNKVDCMKILLRGGGKAHFGKSESAKSHKVTTREGI